jgi:hypothetical protein
MAIDPETLSDSEVQVPPPFEGDQTVGFDDFDLREKPTGFWVLLNFSGENGDKASWSGNFHTAPDTAGRKQNHAISCRGLREFFKAVGMTDGDLPKFSPKEVAKALTKYLNFAGNPVRVKAFVGLDKDGKYMNASRFRAA